MGEGVIVGTVASQEVLCCDARSWARVIGWLQIVGGAIALLVYSIMFILALATLGAVASQIQVHNSKQDRGGGFVEHDGDGDGGAVAAVAVGAFFIAMGILFLGIISLVLVAGIVLVKGVNEGNPGKLTCWLIIEGIFMAFVIIQLLTNLGNGNYMGVAPDLISVAVSIFVIWVVNLHRKELLSAGQTGFGPRI